MEVKMEGENDEAIQSKLLDFTMKDVGTFAQEDFDHVLRYISAFSSRNTFNLASQVIEKVPILLIVVFLSSMLHLTLATLQKHYYSWIYPSIIVFTIGCCKFQSIASYI